MEMKTKKVFKKNGAVGAVLLFFEKLYFELKFFNNFVAKKFQFKI